MKYLLIILLLSISSFAFTQDDYSKRESSVMKLSKSLESNRSDVQIAEDYIKVAKDFFDKKEYSKAEDYLNRARKLYVKLKNNEKTSFVDRELAKLMETQDKTSEAVAKYKSASSLSSNKSTKEINLNDANRLSNSSDLKTQSAYIQKNIELTGKLGKRKERAEAYQQMAQNNMMLDQKDEALVNLKQALDEVKDAPKEAIEIKKEIAGLYVSDNQIDKAIVINKELIKEAQKTKDDRTEVEQLQSLSTNYMKVNEKEKSIQVLEEAYRTAIEKGNTIGAKNSLGLLTELYSEEKQTQKALDIYNDFIDRLEGLIKSDSTLMDSKAFQLQEKRISQLEKEKDLKDSLIKKQDAINYILLVLIVLILFFLVFVAKTLYSIKKKNKKIALQSLRREMNPHFIFNSLNSVNQFIAQNKELEANKYLSSYSKLMRNMMENSNKDFIPLSVELEQLREYLDLEHMRFKDKFVYEVKVDESLDTDSVYIPNMLLQPQLENAIWHGLRYRDDGGLLTLSVEAQNNKVCVRVEDNGIGIAKSKELKTKHQQNHNSRGMSNTQERIALLNDLHKLDITLRVEDKQGSNTGVLVTFCFPLINKLK